jgi:hypothetical protein
MESVAKRLLALTILFVLYLANPILGFVAVVAGFGYVVVQRVRGAETTASNDMVATLNLHN